MTATGGLTIRWAFPDDARAVARLAALDSRRVPAGQLLLAEIDGEPWAAVAIGSGAVIADPFRPTAALVDLLRRRRVQLAAAREATDVGAGRASLSRRRPWARLGGTSAGA
jgi:hypothetical protein